MNKGREMKGWRGKWPIFWLWLFLVLGMSWPAWAAEGLHLQVVRFESRTDAEQVFSDLKSSEGFDLLAEQWAPEGLKQARGYLGRVVPERLSSPARQVLLALKPGQVSPPVAGQEGWFVFRVLDPSEASKYLPGEESAAFYLDKGIVLGELGDSQGELEAYRRAVALDSGLAAAHVNLGEALRRQAMLILEKAAGDPSEVQARTATELLDEAIDEFKAAIGLDRELWEAHFNLGLAYAAQGLLDLTVLEFQEALAIKPDSGELHRSLAIALLMKQKPAEALVHARQAKELGAEVGDLLKRINEKMGEKTAHEKKQKR